MRLSGGVGKLGKLNVKAEEEPKVVPDIEKENTDVDNINTNTKEEESAATTVVDNNGTMSQPNIEHTETENIEEEKNVDNVIVIR